MTSRLRLFTYKAGILSRVAHDLRLHVERFTVRAEGERVVAEIDPRSIVVDGTMRAGQLDGDQLGARDRGKIVETIQREILKVDRFPTIRFEATRHDAGADRLELRGTLELIGVRRPLTITANRGGGRIHARVGLRPGDFGIPPYKALAGAIRLEDRVEVELELDADVLEPGVAPPPEGAN